MCWWQEEAHIQSLTITCRSQYVDMQEKKKIKKKKIMSRGLFSSPPSCPVAWVPVQCASIQWRDGEEREAEWFEHYEEKENWRLKGREEQPDVNCLP